MGPSKRKLLDDDSRQPSPKQHRTNVPAILEHEPVACLHDVSYPEGSFNPLPSSSLSSTGEELEPAKVFPFSLDPFQSEAIKCLETGESVMVMTTEIWRSMQYKGSEVTREVAWIIFDEVHYMRDRERGVVWEESIVMAPKNARFVFLSATVPNAKEFADWVAKVHHQPCHIVYTDYRPTPLQHYIFPSGSEGLYLVVDEKGHFREDSFQKALNALVPVSDGDKKKENNGKWQKSLTLGKTGEDSDIFKMVKMIIQRQYDPVILFSFSKRECEFLAMQMAKLDLNGDDEKVNIETIFWSAMDMLSDDDKKLPQVSNMLPLLKRGIGVHHSGLLPILKEVIEILFQEGLIKKQVKSLEEERDSIVIEEEDSLKNYYDLLNQYKSLKKDIRNIVLSPRYCLPFLQPGRLVSIECNRNDEISSTFSIKDQVTWGLIINFQRVKGVSEEDASMKPESANYTVDVLTRCIVSKDGIGKKNVRIIQLKEHGEPHVVSIPISQINTLASIRILIPNDLLPLEARENTLKKISEVLSRFPKGVPLLDPEEDMKIQSSSYRKAVRRTEALESLFDKHEVAKSTLVEEKLKALHLKQELTAKIRSIKKQLRSSSVLAFKDELKARKRVLRRLGYTTSDDVVELKGKVACEISSANELTLSELMFNGVFKDTKVEEIVALLSCFVWQEKLQDAAKPREELELLFIQLQDTARRVAKVQLECKVEIDVEGFVSSFRPDIMEAVYAWAKGSKFYEIMEITQVFEGSLIRAIRRLEEVLQQLILASKSIGETELETKFEEAVSKIKRDIVFAASLYL